MVQEQQTRRERQREATFDEIVRASRELLAEGAELSLRAVAGRMGMTAPALYRYVASIQELVDLVAFEIDKAATEVFSAAADTQPDDDAAARLVCATVAFRQWALANTREFSLVFANPIADSSCARRDLLTASASGLLFTDLLHDLWVQTKYPIPRVSDLPAAVAEAVTDPLIPANVEQVPLEDRGLIWVYMQGWTMLYGVVTLEVFGHMDPRVIASGEMFIDTVRSFATRIGLDHDWKRLEPLMRTRLAG
ncbi:MAG TPA: WHG domain-containing protein [Nocardioides sp.]|nr:WHG domain-containing protein [Nocardioides sp.]